MEIYALPYASICFPKEPMENASPLTRRQLLGSAALGSLAMTPFVSSLAQKNATSAKRRPLAKGEVILFQGDSITDAGRNKSNPQPNDQKFFGKGYAWMAASKLLVEKSELELTLHNRGISGNKVHQLAERWKRDCLDLRPDLISILIGVNDIWHGLNGRYDGTVQTYEEDFDKLLKRTRESLPKVRLVICEPFVLKCGAVNESWFPEFDKYRAVAKKMAEEHGAIFVPFQSMFDEAIRYAEPKHWAGDGVHPSSHGAALMAHYWIRTVTG